jgi:hypothetical protein
MDGIACYAQKNLRDRYKSAVLAINHSHDWFFHLPQTCHQGYSRASQRWIPFGMSHVALSPSLAGSIILTQEAQSNFRHYVNHEG